MMSLKRRDIISLVFTCLCFCKNLRNSSMDIFKTFTAHAYLEGRRTVSTEKYFLENSGSVPKPFRIEALLANLILGKNNIIYGKNEKEKKEKKYKTKKSLWKAGTGFTLFFFVSRDTHQFYNRLQDNDRAATRLFQTTSTSFFTVCELNESAPR